jgi:cation transport ATPase
MTRSLVNTYPVLIKEKRLLLQNMFPLFTASNGILAGVLGLKYRISGETRKALNNIRARGVTELYILDGETNPAAATLASELGLEILALAELDGLITERKQCGGGVAFVGYGLEGWEQWDAADVKILIKHPSGIYRLRQADLILEHEDLNLLSEAIALSFRASEKERQNVEITALSNTLGIALAFSRILSPVGASMYNSLTSITVSLNSLSLLYR